MKVAIHQPAYLPWLGYLERIAVSDVFVFLDTVQFEKNSFINRNRIKTANGPIWLTVPVLQQGHLGKTMLDTEIDARQPWQSKHLRSIQQGYSKTSGFARKFPALESLYAHKPRLLSDLCHQQLLFWLEQLGISTPVVRASALPVTGHKSDLVLSICQHLKATEYLSGPLGKGYLEEQSFRDSGIRVTYHEYVHPAYPQLYGAFLPAMGVVDYWMNCDAPYVFDQWNQK